MKTKYLIKGYDSKFRWQNILSLHKFDTYKEAKEWWNKNKKLIFEYQRGNYRKYAVFKTFDVPDEFKADLEQ